VQLGRQQLLERCCKYPWMLQVAPAVVLSRAAALGKDLVGLDAARVAAVCRRSPKCLLALADSVALPWWRRCRSCWACPRRRLCSCALGTQSVLQDSPASITAKARRQHGLEGTDLAGCMVR
jgi:hypothetical protein